MKAFFDSLTRPAGRLVAALADPARGNRAMALALAGYVLVWTLYGVLAKGSQDINFDMGEAVAWSRELALGYPKHPPLSAWLVRAWFSLFPLTDASYYLLAMTVAGSGLWLAWLLCARWLDGEKRVVGLALLTLVPLLNILALKYNVNTVMIPLWAAATLCFLRSFETRALLWAALAGLAATAAMLDKYWSVTLLAGLAIAALADPRRKAYFRSAAPWITIAVGLLALAPHMAWIASHKSSTINYALNQHAAGAGTSLVKSSLAFLGGVAGYIAVPVLVALLAARPSRAALADTLWPQTPDRRFALVAFVTPFLVSVAAGVLTEGEIASIWAMPGLSLLPVVLLSSPRVVLAREAASRLVAIAVAFPVLAVALAPVIALMIHHNGVSHYATHYRQLAAAIEGAWRETTDRPLRLVGSYTNVVNGVVFYLRDRPSTLDIMEPDMTPWADDARVRREGVALVCPLEATDCVRVLEQRAAKSKARHRVEVEISRLYFGVPDHPVRYLIVAVPPQN